MANPIDATGAAVAQDRLSLLSKPGTATEARGRLVEMLRRDLVGAHPDLDPDLAREVLEGTSPSTWYLTGFLAPHRKSAVEKRTELADEQQAELSLENQRETEGLEQGAPGAGSGDDAGAAEPPPRRSFEPSSIGLTVLVSPEATGLEARVTWGDYITEPPLPSVLVNPEEREAASKEKRKLDEPVRSELQWRRLPRERTLSIPLKPGLNQYLIPESAAPAYPGGGLELTVSVRTTRTAGIDGRYRDLLAVSVFLVNRRSEPLLRYRDLSFCFQARLQLTSALGFEPSDDRASYDSSDFDERLSDLHYSDVASYATGHNSSADWAAADGERRVNTVFTNPMPCQDVEKLGADIELPGVTRGMNALGDAALNSDSLRTALERLPLEYAVWATAQARLVSLIDGQKRQDVATQLLKDIEVARTRIASGISRLAADPVSREAFAIMNRTMARANRQRGAANNKKPPDQQRAPEWRLFQLAFVLLNLDGLADPLHADRATVDLLFFPTGGGKTEAYLGLAAFAIARRRLANTSLGGAGLSVVMRYTLRLLTLDQLQRAAGLICALELERVEHGRLGKWPIEIGLWVGSGATPNTFGNAKKPAPGSAIEWVLNHRNGRGPAPAPLKDCPWCGSALKPESFHLHPTRQAPQRLDIRCCNTDCPFSADRLPILVVDEEIYRRLPAFMVATIDKFANVPWVGGAGAFFGNVTRHDDTGFYGAAEPNAGKRLAEPLPAIDLIIQDELHLISGPLGTVAGLYETAFDMLASRNINGHSRGPKIVASTATVRRAQEQIKSLFGRDRTAIFPPPGLHRGDSFFAKTDTASPSRLYVGVASPGRGPKLVFLRTLQTLLAGAHALSSRGDEDPADPYLTALCYFNALRELGGARRIVDDEVRAHLSSYGSSRVRLLPTGEVFANRQLREIQELTSRYSTDKVSEARTHLGLPARDKSAVDVALATNMISVGLDIGRLGLMVVQGQPKTAAEYIQATSRVGREAHKPGLVVTLLNVHKPRDRTHYEQFRAFHQSFYRAVEATSVTPFSTRALDRALAAMLVAAVRHFEPSLTREDAAKDFAQHDPAFAAAVDAVRAKMALIGAPPTEIDRCIARLETLKDAWINIADAQTSGGDPFRYAVDQPVRRLLQDTQSQQATMAPERRLFIAGRSMRDTEPVALLRIKTPTGQSF